MAIDKFGTTAVRNAWYDPKQVAEHVLSGYIKVISLWFLIFLFISIFNFFFHFCHTQMASSQLVVSTKCSL